MCEVVGHEVDVIIFQYAPLDLPLDAFVCWFGRWGGHSRVHHLLVPANRRSCRAELRPQRCTIGRHPGSYTAHSSRQSPGAGERGQCQEVRLLPSLWGGGLKGSAAVAYSNSFVTVFKNNFNQNTKRCDNIKESVWVEDQRKKNQIIV